MFLPPVLRLARLAAQHFWSNHLFSQWRKHHCKLVFLLTANCEGFLGNQKVWRIDRPKKMVRAAIWKRTFWDVNSPRPDRIADANPARWW